MKKCKTTDLICTTVHDLVEELLWSGRKEDEDLPRGVIEKAVEEGDISIEEICEEFKRALEGYLLD